MLAGGSFSRDVASWRHLIRCILLIGAAGLLTICMLGMHSNASAYTSSSAVASDTSVVVTSDSHSTTMVCANCGTLGSDGGLMMLCGMVLISVIALVAIRPPARLFLNRLRLLLLRIVRGCSPMPNLTPSLLFLSISRT